MDVGAWESEETVQRRTERLTATVRSYLDLAGEAMAAGDVPYAIENIAYAEVAARTLRKHLTGRDD